MATRTAPPPGGLGGGADLADGTGAPLSLGTQLGRGGEGVVFEVPGRPSSVAKIYLTPPGPELAAKLAAMAASGTAGMSKLAAWPTDLVLDRGRARFPYA